MAEKKQEEEAPLLEEPSVEVQQNGEREHALSENFDDEVVLQELTTGASPSIIQETADAVEELVMENAADTATAFYEPNPAPMLPAEDESAELIAKCEMLENSFELILSEHNFDDLVENLLRGLMNVVGAQVGSIFELDHEKAEYFFRSTIGGGNPQELRSFRMPINQGVVGHVGETRTSMLVEDPLNDSIHLQSISAMTGFTPKNLLAAPIVIANQLYGVVELFNKVGTEHFEPKDLQVLEYAIKIAAKVLESRFFVAELHRQIIANGQQR